MGYETLILERRGRVAWLILNRPESLNAHNLTMLAELPRAWAELDSDDDVGVIVLTGHGKAFSAGADVKEVAASGGGIRERLQPFSNGESPTQASARSAGVSKPVIAAVNGVCAGGGLLLLAGCDLAVAASTATFLDPHVSVGQTTGLEPVELVGIMPLGDIFRMAFVGSYERLEATAAHRLGLVSEVVDPPDLLEDRVQALAESICRNSPAALRHTKRALLGALEVGRTEALRGGWQEIVDMWSHPDNAEGPSARVEGRPPRWAPPSWTP